MNHQTESQSKTPVVKIQDVKKSFAVGGSEVTILKGISLAVEPGEFVSIVGPSGNGKSTLLNMITGIDRPTSGEIIVTGQPVHKMSENELAVWRGEHVGIIFQFFQMLPALSLLQNVVLPMEFAGKYSRAERRARAMDLLELVGLGDQANKLPGMVSGGQQQRAAIARALANDPALLVADEPTGNLDSKTAGEVFALFHELVGRGKTMLMVTHDKDLADQVPRKIEIQNGGVFADSKQQRSSSMPTMFPMTTASAPGCSAYVGGSCAGIEAKHYGRDSIKRCGRICGATRRTVQVALVVALGAFGIGLVIGARNLILDAINTDYRKAAPPAIGLIVSPPMTDDQLLGLKNIDGVETVEGVITTLIEWRSGPDQEWTEAFLRSRKDFSEQTLSKELLLSGQWPAGRQVAISKGSDVSFGIQQGDQVQLRIADRERTVDVVGVIKSPRAAPFFTGNPDFFMERARYEAVVGSANFDTIFIGIGQFDRAKAEAVDDAIRSRLDKLGIDSRGRTAAGQPHHPTGSHAGFQPAGRAFAIMGLVGGVIIFLGLFLVFNSVSAIITQQVNQIGVMKAIGAGRPDIRGYLLLVLAYGLLATLIAAPLGAVAANGLKNFFLDFTNTTNPGFQWDPVAVCVQILVAFLAPVLAALFPILRGVGITVREAISTYGLGGASGLIDRMVTRARGIPYSILLTIGNVFRNKQRVLLIQLTLVGSGIIFIAVTGASDSTRFTFNEELRAIHTYQAGIAFEAGQRRGRVEPLALAQPGVAAVEMWNTGAATVRPIAQAESTIDDERATLLGLPYDSIIYKPQIVSGRWLQGDDARQIVIHKALAEKVGVMLGDQIILTRTDGRESTWQVVGLLYDPVNNSTIYMPQPALARFLGDVNRANALWINTTTDNPADVKEIVLALEAAFEAQSMAVAPETVFNGNTIADITFSKLFTYDLLLRLLAIMAVVIAIVGGIGLSGVLSLSVLERTREIGVMRAIGASSGQITRLFVGEGLLLGILSWLIALPISIPLSYGLTTGLLTTILDEEILYRFTLTGPALWLGIICLLAILASWFPARRATRVSVRESLAYQ
ncbi:MAG: ATP-binding cassette domain-containing protein [Caldilineaceae bacterium]